jgi:TetR/AcrR family transcriptional repressor of nem operon
MRASREVAEKNRQNVVRTAARQFRKHGYDGIGIAGLMKAAGMTQGGFYKQFKNKEALECEATELALRENLQSWTKAIDGREDPIASLKYWYLTPEHLGAVDVGCTYAALAAEATRDRPALQAVFTEAINRQVETLAMELGDDANRREKAIQAMAQIVGSLILARSVDDADLQKEIISAGRS